MLSTPCLLCGDLNHYKILYKENFSEADLNAGVFSARRLPDQVHYQMVQCLKDGMVRSNPVLPRGQAEQLYKRSQLNYGDEIKNLIQTYLAALRPILGVLPKDARILEIGCGNGFMLKALGAEGFQRVCGVEPSAEAFVKADVGIKSRIISDVFRSDMFSIGSIDFIFFFQTLDHLHDPNEFISGCYRLLKPGGYILSFQHNVESLSAKILGEKSPIIDIEHIYLFSPKTIHAFFMKNGFSVQKVYKPVNILSMYHLIWLFPIPNYIKEWMFNSSADIIRKFLKINVRIKLGNLCIIARKE